MTKTKKMELTRLKEELVFTILRYQEIRKDLPEDDLVVELFEAEEHLCRYNLCAITDFLDGETDTLELIVMHEDGPKIVDASEEEMLKLFLPMLRTNGGEYVCTISEVLIANYLLDNEIDYAYRKKKVLKNGEEICPTFTLFNPVTEQEKYFEHFEMMENPERVDEFCRVQEVYIENDLHLGRDYICCLESKSAPLDLEMVDLLIQKCISLRTK